MHDPHNLWTAEGGSLCDLRWKERVDKNRKKHANDIPWLMPNGNRIWRNPKSKDILKLLNCKNKSAVCPSDQISSNTTNKLLRFLLEGRDVKILKYESYTNLFTHIRPANIVVPYHILLSRFCLFVRRLPTTKVEDRHIDVVLVVSIPSIRIDLCATGTVVDVVV